MVYIDNKYAGQKVRELRNKNNWSAEELGRRIPLDKSNVSKMETMGQGIDLDRLQRLAEIFEVDISTFLTDDNEILSVAPLRRVFTYLDFTRFPNKTVLVFSLLILTVSIFGFFDLSNQEKLYLVLSILLLMIFTVILWFSATTKFINHELFLDSLPSLYSKKELRRIRWTHSGFLLLSFLSLFFSLGGLLYVNKEVVYDSASLTINSLIFLVAMGSILWQIISISRNPLYRGSIDMRKQTKYLGSWWSSLNWVLAILLQLWLVINFIVVKPYLVNSQLPTFFLIASKFHVLYMTIIYLEYHRSIRSYQLPS